MAIIILESLSKMFIRPFSSLLGSSLFQVCGSSDVEFEIINYSYANDLALHIEYFRERKTYYLLLRKLEESEDCGR